MVKRVIVVPLCAMLLWRVLVDAEVQTFKIVFAVTFCAFAALTATCAIARSLGVRNPFAHVCSVDCVREISATETTDDDGDVEEDHVGEEEDDDGDVEEDDDGDEEYVEEDDDGDGDEEYVEEDDDGDGDVEDIEDQDDDGHEQDVEDQDDDGDEDDIEDQDADVHQDKVPDAPEAGRDTTPVTPAMSTPVASPTRPTPERDVDAIGDAGYIETRSRSRSRSRAPTP